MANTKIMDAPSGLSSGEDAITEEPSIAPSQANEIDGPTVKGADEPLSNTTEDRAASNSVQNPGEGRFQSKPGKRAEGVTPPETDPDSATSYGQLSDQQGPIGNRQERIQDNASTQNPLPNYESGDRSTFNTEDLERYFSNFSPEILYKAYQTNLRKQNQHGNKGGELITAMVDYVAKVEDDMARLEKNLDKERLARGVTNEELATMQNERQQEDQERPIRTGTNPTDPAQQQAVSTQQSHGLSSDTDAAIELQLQKLQLQKLELKVQAAISKVSLAVGSGVPDPPKPGGGSNHALQDYQMQLMLLEQQNKKRLMMARQEQDSLPHELPDTSIQTRFYNCDGLFGPEGRFVRDGQSSTESGNYLSNTDPIHLLRVLYDWKDKIATNDAAMGPDEPPEAAKIDIIAFMISSQPIADFFEKRLGLSNGATRVLRIGKPFRSIIRNMSQLRTHLSKLEARYGAVEAGVNEPGETHASGNTLGDGVGKWNITIQPDTECADLSCAAQEGVQLLQSSGSPKFDEKPDTAEAMDETMRPEEAESFESPSALKHFQHLIEFIDRYLGAKIDLFEMFQSGSRMEVAYEDLWMLFDTGAMIYCPFQHGDAKISNSDDEYEVHWHTTRRRNVPQAYRVIATVGGGPLRKSLEPRNATTNEDKDFETLFQIFSNRSRMQVGLEPLPTTVNISRPQTLEEKYAALHVICMFLDYNGTKYGTESEIFLFKPFNGEMHIKNLEAFPLHYLANNPSDPSKMLDDDQSPGGPPRGTEYSEALLQRGRKFIDTTLASQHMNHSGLTIGENKEEINSAVIVDFKLAFNEYQKAFPDADSMIPKFIPLTQFWPELGDNEVYDFSSHVAYCDDLYCHRVSHLENEYYGNQKQQLAKLELRIKQWLEDFDNRTDKDDGNTKFKTNLEEQNLIQLLPGVVPGFSLRNRAWVQLNLDQLEFVEQRDDWKKLVLPKGHKQIVQAMVETHSRGSSSRTEAQEGHKAEMDLVRGKGRGCIILLHGVPGVGKTSTAECVASYTKRPLYPITCGDIGYEPEAVERHMGRHFKLAYRWGCVLLLDEADVFLAKRNKSDVKRNGLVSAFGIAAFLRILEYYSGILFLTTNRVGALDDAFRSRLHLTLYYPPLTEKQTLKIWRTNLNRIKAINKERSTNGRVPIKFDRRQILRWIEKYWRDLQWNGRQIRNAFQTAMALAEFEAKQLPVQSSSSASILPELKTKQFVQLATASAQFSQYLQLVHGDGEEENARRDQVRAVNFHPKTTMSDFNDTSEEESSGSNEPKGGSDHGSDSDSRVDSESQSEDSEQETNDKSKRKRKSAKEHKSKSKPHSDGTQGKGKVKGKRK